MLQGNRRETRLLGILSFVHSTVWKVLFGKVCTFFDILADPAEFCLKISAVVTVRTLILDNKIAS